MDPFVICVLYLSCLVPRFIAALIVFTCCERTDLLGLLCVIFSCNFVTFPYGVLGHVLQCFDSLLL